MIVKLVDTHFAHTYCCRNGDIEIYPDKLVWNRGNEYSEITVYTDSSINKVGSTDSSKNVALLLESPVIQGRARKAVQQYYDAFDHILTFDKTLLDLGGKYTPCWMGGTWIKRKDQKIYNKKYNVCIIASNKRDTAGQLLRHMIISHKESQIDLICGGGYKPIDYKLEVLKDYRYSIVIENGKYDYYFSEKLLDCFFTGTIPIYCGCPSIDKFFNTDGMILFSQEDDLNLNDISETQYNSMIAAVKENFELAKKYEVAENTIYDKLKELYGEC